MNRKQSETHKWYPFFVDSWMWGSTRHELIVTDETGGFLDLRAIWVDLMTLSKKDGGFIRANEKTPYPLGQLAGMFCVPVEILKQTIDICIKVDKLTEPEPGIYFVVNTDKYEFTQRHKRRVYAEPTEPPEDIPYPFNLTSIKCPEKFIEMADRTGNVRMNRLVAAIGVGRALTNEEQVHHINHDTRDNRPTNLMLFATHRDHLHYEWHKDIKPIWDGNDKMSYSRDLYVQLADLNIYKSIVDNRRSYNGKGGIPPPLDEVIAYFKEKNVDESHAKEFFNHYESNGWKVGKNPMQKWRASASGWISRIPQYTRNQQEQQTPIYHQRASQR